MTLVLPLTSYHSLSGSGRQDDSLPSWSKSSPQNHLSGRCDSPVMTRPSRPATTLPSRPTSLSPLKRKQEFGGSCGEPRPKRISPFLNTPKQRRDEMRKVLRLSASKFRQIEDHEACLRKFVLINNTVRRLEREWLDDKRPSPSTYASRFLSPELLTTDDASRKRSHSPPCHCDFDFVGNSPLSSPPPPTTLLDDFRSSPCAGAPDDHAMTLPRAVPGLDDSDSDDSLPSPTNESQSLIDSLTSASSSSSSSCSSVTTTSSLPLDTRTSTLSSPALPCSPAAEDSCISERDRLILGQMDIVFNNLISVLSEAAV